MDEVNKRFESMAALVDEASLLLDAKSIVVQANEKALTLLGNYIIGYPIDRFLRHADFAEAVRLAHEDSRPSSLDYTLMDQVRRSFTLRIARFDEAHVMLVIFDGTMSLSVDRIRSDFVANVSHELRSPLTALSGFIETLQDGAIDDGESRDRFLTIMRAEAGRMQRLIDDLLSLSRVEAEEHRPPDDAVAILPVLRELVSAMRDEAAKNGKTLSVNLADELADADLLVRGAQDELRQVFQNLVENAVRYGAPETTISILLSTGRLAGGQLRESLLRVQVVNQGETIAPEHLARLTERFYRIDKGRSRQFGGTGLGLAIVKHIVNRHRGRLRISSGDGQTTVSVTLPRIFRQ